MWRARQFKESLRWCGIAPGAWRHAAHMRCMRTRLRQRIEVAGLALEVTALCDDAPTQQVTMPLFVIASCAAAAHTPPLVSALMPALQCMADAGLAFSPVLGALRAVEPLAPGTHERWSELYASQTALWAQRRSRSERLWEAAGDAVAGISQAAGTAPTAEDSAGEATDSEDERAAVAAARRGARSVYPPHLLPEAAEAAVQRGRLFRGTFRAHRSGKSGRVMCTVPGGGASGRARVEVVVAGQRLVNRAVDGDTVAVALLPQARWLPVHEAIKNGTLDGIVRCASWRCAAFAHCLPASFLAQDGVEEVGDLEGATVAADEEAADDVDDASSVGVVSAASAAPGAILAAAAAGDAVPAGRVVAVLQRRWRPCVCTLADRDVEDLDRVMGEGGASATAPRTVTAVPMDSRLPKVTLKTRQVRVGLGLLGVQACCARACARAVPGWQLVTQC